MLDPILQFDVYNSLDPATKLVASVYGICQPTPLARTSVARICAQANLRIDGKRLTQDQTRDATSTLIKMGIAYRRHNDDGVMLYPDWIVPIVRDAERDFVVAMWDAFEREIPRYGYSFAPDRVAAMVRNATIIGDFVALEDVPSLPSSAWRFLAYDASGELLQAVPRGYRDAAIAAAFDESIGNLCGAEPLIEAGTAADAARFAGEIALLRVLQGRFDDALAVFTALPENAGRRKACVVAQASTRALIAALLHDDDQLIRSIDAACDAEKSGTRKRYVFPSGPAFALAVAALVRIDTPASSDYFERLLRAAERANPVSRLVNLALDARAARRGEPWGYWTATTNLELLFMAIAHSWLDGSPVHGRRDFRPALLNLLERAERQGFDWLVAESAAVVQALNARASAASPPAHDADRQRALSFGDSVADTSRRAVDQHARLGTTSLTTLVQGVPKWEMAIRDLELLAFETKSKSQANKQKVAADAPAERLVWVVAVTRWGEIEVSAKLQRMTKAGHWTRGKPVSTKSLAGGGLPCLIAADRAVISTMKPDVYRRGAFFFDDAAVYELGGHPNVVDARGQPLEVVRTDPELIVGESDDRLTARLVPYGDEDAKFELALVDGRCEVTRLGPSHARLRDIIPPEGLSLPQEARPRFMEAVTALAAEIRIHSSVGGATADVADGDPRPCVQLVPNGAGLTVSLVVEPVPGSGQFFTPAHGGAQIYAPDAQGGSIAVTRDLAAERAQLNALLVVCPVFPAAHSPFEPLTLANPAHCLELLEQLAAAGARCTWPNGEPFKLVAHADSKNLRVAITSSADWFSASAELDVEEDTVLDLKRLFELMDARPGTRFLELDAGRFLALTESFRRELEEVRALTTPGKGNTVRIHPLAAGLLDEVFATADLAADRAWQEQCARFNDAQSVQVDVPSTLQAELRPYQAKGFEWLARLSHTGAGACLADDMGLGKTVQALALLLHRAANGPALVIAPTSVAANWIKEAARFAPTLKTIAYTGDRAARADLVDSPEPYDLVVSTYGLLQNDIERLGDVHWHTVVLDEAQAVKNIATKRSHAVMALNADFRIATTGTPIQNNLMDLYALFRFLNPGMLGSAAEFQRRYAIPIERDADPAVRARLHKLIAPFVLRRLKTQVLDDLPARTEITLDVELSAPEAALYEALRQRALDDLEATDEPAQERQIEVFAHLTRLRLACCNPALVQAKGAPPSSKLAMFAQTLGEILSNRHKVLVFSQFVKHLRLVEAYLQEAGIHYHYLDGATAVKTREKRINAFQAGDGDVFLISLKAGGTGLNLTAADYVIHLDPWWNPAVEDQASDRAHRIGQTRPVTIYRLVTKGTIEERIVELHRHKRDLADQLLEGTNVPARLDAGELLALLRE